MHHNIPITWNELKKWLEWHRPSTILDYLWESDRVRNYPELLEMYGAEQNSYTQGDADVWEHTQMVMDAVGRFCLRDKITGERRQVLLLAALLHDTGKPRTTELNNAGWIHHPEHEVLSTKIAASLLTRWGVPESIRQKVIRLVRWHHMYAGRSQKPTWEQVRGLIRFLGPASINDWAILVEADIRGRRGSRKQPVTVHAQMWLDVWHEMQIAAQKAAQRPPVQPQRSNGPATSTPMKPKQRIHIPQTPLRPKTNEAQQESMFDVEKSVAVLAKIASHWLRKK